MRRAIVFDARGGVRRRKTTVLRGRSRGKMNKINVGSTYAFRMSPLSSPKRRPSCITCRTGVNVRVIFTAVIIIQHVETSRDKSCACIYTRVMMSLRSLCVHETRRIFSTVGGRRVSRGRGKNYRFRHTYRPLRRACT